MKIASTLTILAITSVLGLRATAIGKSYEHNKPVGKRQVRIYLRSNTAPEGVSLSEIDHALAPVFRLVSKASPMRGAIQSLIAGPTEEEKTRGFDWSHTDNLSIKRLSFKHGIVRVSLRSINRNRMRWPGDASPPRFRAAVTKNLKQFPGVRRVIICLDGYENFDDQRDGAEKKCK